MTITIKDGSRFRSPGPLGSITGGFGGRAPGPLGIGPTIVFADAAITAMTKTFKMPSPAKGDTNYVHEFTWKLFNKGEPALADVKQGNLAVCPIASVLGALAYTSVGRGRIHKLITERGSPVTTDVTGVAKVIGNPPSGNKIVSSLNRYFSVSLDGTFEVSDVLYTDDADANWTPTYMRSPTEALWPCMIEKAYAVKIGSYEDLDDFTKHSLNEFWGVLVGKPPETILAINDQTNLSEIANLAKNAANVPTVGASKEDATAVLGSHGLPLMGLHGNMITMQDPNKTKPETISVSDFRSNFQAIFSGKP